MFGQYQSQAHGGHLCGLYYNFPSHGRLHKSYLPQVEVKVHASILATTSRTKLQQTFQNPSKNRAIREVRYAFPLYDGVSVVGFQCHVGNRLIVGEVKAKDTAKKIYKEAVERGETAGLLEQLPEASDVFTTTIGNIPPGAKVTVDITYLGELKHDMEVDGIRFTIPTSICPRYGNVGSSLPQMNGTIAITVDAEMTEGSFIQRLQSPSHPISMSMGTTSVDPDATPSMSKASATLSLGVAHLETDFVLQVIARDTGIPKAILETHPTIPNQRALMATLVPKFALPPEKPEIVFVCDQSGSMSGSSMELAKEALQVFLKSLPLGVKFNICSFGSHHSFLFPRSASYSQDTLATATRHAAGLSANYGGTNMLEPLRATIQNRYNDMPLDIILLTDGEIWEQQQLFDYLNAQIQDTKAPIRVFTLGVGSGVSHSLIEGIAKAGNGFAQSVQEGEKMNSKVVRMLKGALSPHVNDYTLEVKYSAASEDDFEVVERVAESLKVALDLNNDNPVANTPPKKISLFDSSFTDSPAASEASEDPYSHLPLITAPKILQAPQSIPSLFAFNRSTVYLLLSPSAPQAVPTSVILRGTSVHGPLELEIPVQILSEKGETIHQLAAKKAVSELEQGRGWLACAQTAGGVLLKNKFEGRFSDILEREAVRLGVQFQVGGKWCAFVATERTNREPSNRESKTSTDQDWEYLEDSQAAELENHEMHARHASASQQQYSSPASLRTGFPQPPGSAAQQPFQNYSPFAGLGARTTATAQLFGAATAPAPRYRAPVQSTLFGGPVSSAPSGASLFKIPSAPFEPRTGGLFGSSSAQNTASTGGMFGSSSANNTPSTGGLFGSSANNTPPTGGLFGQTPAIPASSSSDAKALQDYQMGLMLLHQDNPKRLHMAPAAAATASPFAPATSASPALFSNLGGTTSAPASSPYAPSSPPAPNQENTEMSLDSSNTGSALENFDFDSFLHTGEDPTAFTNAVAFNDFTYAIESGSGDSATKNSPQSAHSPQDLLRLLIAHQSFTGAFPHHPRVLSWLGISPPDCQRALKALSALDSDADADADAALLTTALVVVYIEKHLAALKGEWELVVDKARAWLEGECGGDGGEVFLRAAAGMV